MLKKLLFSGILAAFFLVTLVTPYARAQVQQGGTWYHPTFDEYVQKVYDPNNEDEIFGERYTQAQVVWIFHALKATLIPEQLLACLNLSLGSDIPTCIVSWISGIISVIVIDTPQDSNLASVVNKTVISSPLSGIGYVKNTLSKFHLVPEAKAQEGFGFGTLSSIQSIWGAIRNVSYFLLVISFVILAFMVMFRVKISPQTVITIQSAIPRIIFILIFITFSYAIAGFLIDLTYTAVGLLALAFDPRSDLDATGLYLALISSHPIIAMLLIALVYFIVFAALPGLAVGIIGSIASVGTFGVVVLILEVILFIVILVVFVIIFIRLQWVLLRTFINIVLLIIFAPILILTGIFPGENSGFGSWIRNLTSQLAVFPTVIAMLFLAHFMFWTSVDPSVTFDLAAPATYMPGIFNFLADFNLLNPYGIVREGTADTVSLPGFNFGTGMALGFIVSFGILFLVPSVTNIIQSVISRRPFGYGTAIFAPIATGTGIGFYPISSAWRSTAEARSEAYGKMVQSRIVEPLLAPFRRAAR